MTKVYETEEEEIAALELLEEKMEIFTEHFDLAETQADFLSLRKELLEIGALFVESCPHEDLIEQNLQMMADIERQIAELEGRLH